MKKYIYILGVFFAMSIGLLSCSDNDDPTPNLSVTPTKLEFGSNASTKQVAVKTEFVKWTVKSNEEWISCSISSSNEEIAISVKENLAKEKRNGTITVQGVGVADVTVEIVQEAYSVKPSLKVDLKELDFLFDDVKQSLLVDAQNVEWKVESSEDWLVFEINPENNSEIWVTPKKNATSVVREGNLKISGKGVADVVVKVIQHKDYNNSKIIWDRNSLHFAKLLGNVSFVDFTDFYGRNVNFDKYGFVKDFIFKMNDDKGTEYEFTVKYEYLADRRISKIYTQGISVDFIYGDHNNYLEVTKDVFGPIGLSNVYLFLPDYLRGLKSIVATHPEAKLTFDFNFTGNQLSVLVNNDLWRKIEYKDGFPLSKQYAEAGEKKGEDGKLNKYINYITQEFTFNTSSGKLIKSITDQEYQFEDKSIPTERNNIVYTYLDDKYNNIEYEGPMVKYTYDSYGEWDRIVAKTPDFENIDQYQYSRDGQGNWTRRIDRAIFRGEEWNYEDKRVVKYFK